MIDFCIALFGFALAHYLSPKFHLWIPHHYGIVRGGACFGATLVASGYVIGIYDRHVFVSIQRIATQALVVNGLAMAATTILFSWLGLIQIGRLVILGTILLSSISMFLSRLLARELARRAKIKVMFVGPSRKVRRMAAQFRRFYHSFYGRPAYFDPDSSVSAMDRRTQLLDAFHQHQPDEIVVVENEKDLMDVLHHSASILSSGCAIYTYSKYYESLVGEVPVESIDHRAVIGDGFNVGSFQVGLAKRPFDVAMAFIGLVVGIPIMLTCALLVMMTSPGPIIYSQIRVGRYGRAFRIYKFRTMRVDAERNGAVWAGTSDNRVTPVGRFLRKTRLDELPQLWNILRGEMSLVGPRPERPEFVEKLRQQVPHYDIRHLVAPGLTGWAQVRYRYGATIADAQRKLAYDLFYVRNCSMAFDVAVCLRTLAAMARGAR